MDTKQSFRRGQTRRRVVGACILVPRDRIPRAFLPGFWRCTDFELQLNLHSTLISSNTCDEHVSFAAVF